jgi:hypothetical protein
MKTFQHFMNAVLAGLKWKSLLVYMDDICEFSTSFDGHVDDLISVFELLREAKLKLRQKNSICFKIK